MAIRPTGADFIIADVTAVPRGDNYRSLPIRVSEVNESGTATSHLWRPRQHCPVRVTGLSLDQATILGFPPASVDLNLPGETGGPIVR